MAARQAMSHAFQIESLRDISDMAVFASVLKSADLFSAGFSCRPYSLANRGVHGDQHPEYRCVRGSNPADSRCFAAHCCGFDPCRNWEKLCAMFGKRHDVHGLSDRALLFENVENLLTYMPKERLALLKGFHTQIYVVSAACFACATHRVRLIGVCFRSEDDMARFEPPAALTDRPSALKDCIDDVYSKRSVWGTFLFAKQAKLRTHLTQGKLAGETHGKLAGKTIVGRGCELADLSVGQLGRFHHGRETVAHLPRQGKAMAIGWVDELKLKQGGVWWGG